MSTYQIKRHSIQWVRDKSYLTSSDPTLTHYSDIVSDKVLEVYVWNLFWHYFWHSIWHLVWHSVWHTLWHLFWPYFWHLLWHSIWHLFWHSIWHSFWQILWHSSILFGIYSDRHPYWQTFPGVLHSILRFRYGSGPLMPTVTPRYAGQAEEVDDDFIKIERPSLTGQVGEKEETLFRTVMPLICDFHVFFSQRSGVIFLQRSEVWICRTSCVWRCKDLASRPIRGSSQPKSSTSLCSTSSAMGKALLGITTSTFRQANYIIMTYIMTMQSSSSIDRWFT